MVSKCFSILDTFHYYWCISNNNSTISSITTSTLAPLCAINVITLEQMFPLTLGANIGTINWFTSGKCSCF